MTAPPEDIAAELLADPDFVMRLAEMFRDEHDQLRKDLRRLLRIPADQRITDDELISRTGLLIIAGEAAIKTLTESGAL